MHKVNGKAAETSHTRLSKQWMTIYSLRIDRLEWLSATAGRSFTIRGKAYKEKLSCRYGVADLVFPNKETLCADWVQDY
jgi:hypothetical protein